MELQQREADTRAQMVTLAAARDDAAKKLAQIEKREERDDRAKQDELPDVDSADALAKVQIATLTSKFTNAPRATATSYGMKNGSAAC